MSKRKQHGKPEVIVRDSKWTVDGKETAWVSCAASLKQALGIGLTPRFLDRSLWIPPSRPSFGMPRSATKTLVFSDWSMMPDAIAALLSYEASRRMGISPDLVSRTIGIDELMPMLYPSPSLVELVDPLALELRFGRAESYENLHAQACMVLREQLAADTIAKFAQTSDRLAALSLDKALKREVDWSNVSVIEDEGHDEHGAMPRTITTFSREKERYKDLIKSLATYRLAFGQPRQDELMNLFSDMDDDFIQELSEFQISLRPMILPQ